MGSMSGQDHSGRAAQPDLFGERGLGEADGVPAATVPQAGASVAGLTDGEVIEALPEATLSSVEGLCEAVVARSLEGAVPALERLWSRFAGFGIDEPLAEQRAVLGTLPELRCGSARTALKRIVLSKDLPASQLPLALGAAAEAGLVLPAAFIGPLLGHQEAAVREPAYMLALRAGVPDVLLRTGLRDPSNPVRCAAALALGLRGDGAAKEVLIAELVRDPSREVIEALAAIGGDEAIVHLGRCAERRPDFAGCVIDVLRDLESARSERLVGHLEAASRNTVSGAG